MPFPGETRVIRLFSPVTLEGGVILEEVTMREPLVRDRIAHAKDRGNEEEKEARMIALLCNLSEKDIWQLTAADYAQLLDAFNVFMLPPAKRPKDTSSGR
ncbi:MULTISPECIES: phage tail assembly protein [Escherichia]|uniref:Phage tail assembly protein n=1 Tax=Escherichia fergusonii TaxID=564 RepID=A0A7L6VMM8_ESCFE|nr:MULTISPECIES: phage tail assembly protein [Escherichia]EFL7018703.1 phage tail assembly protein [Escherichia coli]AXM02780.1 phage tail assembly protein [Escherichia fergusonii]EFL4481253.1 phage tail assembly protein [Escherichia fergusonii]EHG6155649.1 phage tail assembly protein [Escherichia fergusonii]EHG6163379.1 phage tail assembly protein [Escherichia fergusonii]